MKPFRGMQSKSEVLLFCILTLGTAIAQPNVNSPLDLASAAPAGGPATHTGARAFPELHLWSGVDLTYLGMYSSDAQFHASSRFSTVSGEVPGERIVPAASAGDRTSQSEVPEWMLLPSERIVENLEPPAHAQSTASLPSRVGEARNHALTFMYGRPSVIRAPRYVVTDSRQRLILSDPEGLAVHVLDPRGKTSFRLICGKAYRVHKPAGVATDADDNIYVSDSEHGMLVVFDSAGNFLRYIGEYHGEPDYARPQGIVIDAKRRHLFVVDTPRNQVFELDLEGHILKRLGKNRRGEGIGEFDSPTDVTLNHERIFVLDRSGTRIQVLSKDFAPVRSFDLPYPRDTQASRDNGVAADQEGNVYVSFSSGATVRVYTQEGALKAVFGQDGNRAGQFAGPQGLWITERDRLYVADSGNGRVQIFQLKHAQ